MRADRASDNAAGRCQARRPGRLLEAMCKHGPRGMAVTYHLRKRVVPYRTRLTGWLIIMNEGFGVTRRTPRHFPVLLRTVARMSAAICGMFRWCERLVGVAPDIAEPVIGRAFARPVGSSGLRVSSKRATNS